MGRQLKKLTRKHKVVISVAVIVLLPVLFLVVGFWPGSTARIEAVADQFQPGDGWVLESETVNPPRFICLQADCNTMSRSWSLGQNITTDELREVVSDSPGFADLWSEDVECAAKPNSTGGSILCEVKGTVSDTLVTLFALGDYSGDYKPKIILRIESR